MVVFSRDASSLLAGDNNWYYLKEYLKRAALPHNWLNDFLLVAISFLTALKYFAFNTFLILKKLCCKTSIERLAVD